MGMSGPDLDRYIYIYIINTYLKFICISIYIYNIHILIYIFIYIYKTTQPMIAHPLVHRTSRTSINNYERFSPTKP